MKFIKAAIPHLTIALALALLVLEICNEYNPFMGFLQGRPAMVLIAATSVCAVCCGALLYAKQRKD